MRIKLSAVLVATLILGSSTTAAHASQIHTTRALGERSQITQPITANANKIETTYKELPASRSAENGQYILLGEAFFSRSTNQGVALQTSTGQCITDSQGCWNLATSRYVPVMIDQTKLLQIQGFQGVEIGQHFTRAGGWNTALGVLGLATAVSLGVLLVAMTPISIPVTVVTVATVVSRVAGMGASGIAACRGLFNSCN